MVGIDEYVRPSIPKLRYAVADAKLFSQALQDTLSIPKEHIFLMTSDAVDENSQPRFVNVAYRLSYLKGKIKKDDTFIFYFAGHGVTLDGEPFLLTEEADNRSALTLKATSLHAGDLMSTLQKNESANVWVTLDACRNNPDDSKGEAKLDPAVNDSLSKANIGLQHTGTMFSCGVGERAWEWDEKKHGCYSYFLVEGLRRNAADGLGRITLPGLDQYLREQVPVVTKRFGAPQNPKIFYGGSTSAQWVLATLATTAAENGAKEDQTARYMARLESLQARLDSETALRVQAEQRAKLADSQRQQLEQQLALMERQVSGKATPVSSGTKTNPDLVAYQDQANSRALQSEINRLREENDNLKKRLSNLEQEVAKVGMAPRSVVLEGQPLLQKAWDSAEQVQSQAEKDLTLASSLTVRQALTQKVDIFQAAYRNALAERRLSPALKKETSDLAVVLETRKLLSEVYQARQDAAGSALEEARRRLDESLAREEKYKLVIAGLQQDLAQVEEKLARCQEDLVRTKAELSEALRKLKSLEAQLDKERHWAFYKDTNPRGHLEGYTRTETQLRSDLRKYEEAQRLPP